LDEGVYIDPEKPDQVIQNITPANFEDLRPVVSGAEAADVTGGMLAKVKLMLALVKVHPAMQIQIFSGMKPGNIKKALAGEVLGTIISH